jgi:pantothenate kinase type III
MRLLVDAGNSALKLALSHQGGIWTHRRCEPTAEAIDAFVGSHRAGLDELVLLPTAERHAGVARAWWGGRPMREVGKELALPALGQYPGCGADRVLAGWVAVTQEGGSVVVVDAGSATTLSAWGADERGEARFAGGMIAPGRGACALGLHAAAPALPLAEPLGSDADPRQRDTRGAIGAAIGIGHPALVRACLERLRQAAGIERTVVTGGDAAALIAAGIAPRLAYRPTLVLEGLEELARRA